MGTAATTIGVTSCVPADSRNPHADYSVLDDIISQPVLKIQEIDTPLILAQIELSHYNNNFICRVRTPDGLEGISVSNNDRMRFLYPIFLERIAPFFKGKDARDWEKLLQEVYLYKSNYKLQNLALWVPLATLEFAVLDLMGKALNKPMGALFGDIHHREVAIYQANNFRGESAEESFDLIKAQVEETGAKALKFKIGGRMRNNLDIPPGRTEKLIPLISKYFGDDMTLYADSNGSYDTTEAIRIGRILEENGIDFYEEPVPFDWYQETLEVSDALHIPVAGGEQEPSMRNFRWLIGNNALDIVQPDIFYYGGMVRSMKVAKMAEATGKQCIPHISGSGLGYLYMMHFVSALPNAGPYHEFKGFNKSIPFECETSPLQSENGKIRVPAGPGIGIRMDPGFIQKHKAVKTI